MDVDEHLLVAIVAALLNFMLSLIVPTLLKDSDLPFATEIKKNYENNKDIILVSSVITIVFVFVSLKITPYVKSNLFSNMADLNSQTILIPNKNY